MDKVMQSFVTGSTIGVPNECNPNMEMPKLLVPSHPADYNFAYGKANSKWPIRCFVPFKFNVNAGYGGRAAIAQISCQYGGKGNETTNEIKFVLCGFDRNHISSTTISASHSGHFGPSTGFYVEENGNLIPDCLFGHNDVSFITNDCRYGNLGHGIIIDSAEGGMSTPLNINVSTCSIVLCSSINSDGTVLSAFYMIRAGFKDNNMEAKLVKGSDEWKLTPDDSGMMTINGPAKSRCVIFSNKESFKDSKLKMALTQQCSFSNGTSEAYLTRVSDSGTALVICSTSNGTANATAGALYRIWFKGDGEGVQSECVSQLKGSMYKGTSGDLWKFKLSSHKLFITGPEGPCRYAIISNLPQISSNVDDRCSQTQCLATEEAEALHGAVNINNEGVIGWLDKESDIVVMINEKPTYLLKSETLMKEGGKFTFHVKWQEKDLAAGSYLVQVYAVRTHLKDSSLKLIELDHSPSHYIIQPTGVLYALNCGGPLYQGLNGIIYTSEHHQYVNFGYDFQFGSQYKTFGQMKSSNSIPQLRTGTDDSMLYMTGRSATAAEAVENKKIHYHVSDLPNGKVTLRLHLISKTVDAVIVNGTDISKQLNDSMSKQLDVMEGNTAFVADADIDIKDGQMDLTSSNLWLAGFAIIDKMVYKEKEKDEEQIKHENDEKQRLSDKLEPIVRDLTRKELKIVGWSPNLLDNPSGELGNMTGWQCVGDWKTHDGGYGTEKAFITSHMWCEKYQIVDLTKHFSTKYLDTAPQIQINEWYREGVGGGGYYAFYCKLLDENEQTIKEYIIPETGKIYRNNAWTEEGTTFKNYGTGVRKVIIGSKGKDDKFWGGHWGPIISTSVVRVAREKVAAENDSYSDLDHSESLRKERTSRREKLVAKIFDDHKSLMAELAAEDIVPILDPNIAIDLSPKIVKRKRRKQEIRVFVSSTFRDFREEREELIKKTFREINGLCMERGVFFTYVDLRWGITEDQTNHGKTIAICLQEIDRCRPYFICMMGERYGWSQQENKPDDLLNQSFDYAIENFPRTMGWVDRHRIGSSVTRLEVLHGCLNNVEENKDRCFFYIREPVKREKFDDEKTYKIFKAESEWHAQQQNKLREQVESMPELKKHRYESYLDAAALIKKDLVQSIEEDFPLGTAMTSLEKQHEAHQAFAAVRQRVYIGRDEYFTKIDEAIEETNNKPFVILGESGSGKSALVANWAAKFEEKEPNTFFFVHFIGSSAESASYLKLLRRLYETLKLYFNINIPVPVSDQNLIRDLSTWLIMAGSQSKCIIVLDALNQLDDGSGTESSEHDLMWLPRELPQNVHIICSTLPGRAFEAVKAAGWKTMQVLPLQPSEKMDIVTGYMEGIYGKTLSNDQKNMIVEAEQTNNPLYLKALLDEIRMFGSFRALEAKIKEYLTADTPGDLFAKILERLEQDFEISEESKSLVRHTTSAIWCSSRGMSEQELLDLLKVPSAVWSPFYLSLIENLVNRGGIVNFFHDHLRQAVESKYLPTAEDKKKGYKWLANFFDQKDMDDRVAEELPGLLSKCGDMKKLHETISNLDIFHRLAGAEDGRFTLIKSWQELGDFSKAEEAYTNKISELTEDQLASDHFIEIQRQLATFLQQLGLFGGAKKIFKTLLDLLENKYASDHSSIIYNPVNQSWLYKCTHPAVLELQANLGEVCQKQKEFEDALDYYTETISRQDRAQSPQEKLQLTEALLGQATVLVLQEDMMLAKKFTSRARELATQVLGPRHHFVAAIINKLGELSYKQGRFDEAMSYFLQDLNLTRGEVGTGHPRTACILNDLALVLDDKNDKMAGELYEAALSVLLDTYGRNHLDVAVIRYNLGSFYFGTDYYSKARFQFTEAHKIYEQFLGADHPDTKLAQKAMQDLSNETN